MLLPPDAPCFSARGASLPPVRDDYAGNDEHERGSHPGDRERIPEGVLLPWCTAQATPIHTSATMMKTVLSPQ